jgi:predicted ATPase
VAVRPCAIGAGHRARVILMTLLRMALGSYRCFAQRQDIQLSPITVILGKNNSGKSALVRAPVVCNTGIRTDSPAPLDLDVLNEGMLDSFVDLIYGNRPHGNVLIELEFDHKPAPLKLSATVQHIDEYRNQVVSFLELQMGKERAALKWEPRDPPENLTYSIQYGGRTFEGVPIEFKGLLPAAIDSDALSGEALYHVMDTATAIRNSYPTVRYFGPFRDRPQRRYRLPARMPTEVGMSGEFAAGILANDIARGQGRLVQQVNQDLADNLPGWSLSVVERSGMYSVLLTSRGDDSLRVNLADAGTGVAQVLPIFVQRAVDILKPPRASVLEVIEQPELHLHPAAHAALADLYLYAAERTRVRFIIETHSETLLLRLRRRIAEGLNSDMVAVYFIDNVDGEAHARRVNVSADGSLDYWPDGVFSEDYDETRALAAAQLAKGDLGAG